MKFTTSLIVLLFCFQSLASLPLETLKRPLSNFYFGSCNQEKKENPFWRWIADSDTDFFLWLGDAVYADTNDPEKLEAAYLRMLNQDSYQYLLSKKPTIGVWDDHDYGDNNVGRDYRLKDLSQSLFLDFIGEDMLSARWEQNGIYTSYTIGPEGKQVKFLLLDLRYFRDVKSKTTIMGSEQWAWLDKELSESKAQVHFLVSSTSVLLSPLPFVEQWSDFRNDYHMLFEMLDSVPGLMFLVGDLHFSGVLKKRIQGRNYYELMSSGLTHSIPPGVFTILSSQYRRQNVVLKKNVSRIAMNWEELSMDFEVFSESKDSLLKKTFFQDDNKRWVLKEE